MKVMIQDKIIRDVWNELITRPANKNDGQFQLSVANLQKIIYKHLGKPEREKHVRPFEEGKTYETKFQTKELFKIVEIKYKLDKDAKKNVPYYFMGYYVGKEHIGLCPINADRLIPKTT